MPFINLSSRPNGDITPCCRYANRIGNITDAKLEDIWNGKEMQSLRQQFIDNKRPKDCWQCWVLESSNILSLRQRVIYPNYISRTTQQEVNIPTIELKLNNLCNFRCRTCKVETSSGWSKDWDIIKNEYELIGHKFKDTNQNHFNSDNFLNSILNLSKTVKVLEFAGGEPLVDPLHYKILNLLLPVANNLSLKYSTNLSILKFGKHNVIKLWKKFKNIDLSISLDGTEELNNYIRTGSNTNKIKENLFKVRKELGDKFNGRLALCFSAYNAWNLPDTYEWFSVELGMPVHGNIAYFPDFINPQILPKDLKSKIFKKYEKFKNKKLNCRPEFQERIHQFLTDNYKYMVAKDQSKYWNQFLRFNLKLDRVRQTNLFKTIPIFKEYNYD